MDDYEINDETFVVLAIDGSTAKVIEQNNEHFVSSSSYKIMDNSCKYFGSSYKGRLVGSKDILNSKYKLPIVIEQTRGIIFFPTTSPRNYDCSWISLNHIKRYERYSKDKTLITFSNNKQMVLNMPFASFQNQILRANMLNVILQKRILGD